MTNNWFECKVSYQKTLENGLQKKVSENYLVDALSFAEAEERFIEEITPFMQGEFEVSGIRQMNFSEIFCNAAESADRWFRCKVAFITFDERSGMEKKTNCYMMVQAGDLRDAVKELDLQMKGTLSDYRIVEVKETNIMDVYPYKAKEA